MRLSLTLRNIAFASRVVAWHGVTRLNDEHEDAPHQRTSPASSTRPHGFCFVEPNQAHLSVIQELIKQASRSDFLNS